MGKRSDKTPDMQPVSIKAAACTLLLLAAALAIITASSYAAPRSTVMHAGDFADTAGSNGYFLIQVILSGVNVLIVLYLMFIYARDYVILKSGFTLGLLAFLFSFLLYSLSTLPIHGLGVEEGTEAFNSFIPLLFSAIGLLIFAKISSE